MGFYRIFPSKDTFITDATIDSVTNRATGSNFGFSPVLSVFSQKNEYVTGSIQIARSLLQFGLVELSESMFLSKTIPSSSISYYLKMFDMKHDSQVPTSYDLHVYPLSRSWDEGSGIDIDDYLDTGYCNWLSASSVQSWTLTGSDFHYSGYGSGSQHFDLGHEDLEVDITPMVNAWLTGNLANNGLIVKLGGTEESGSNISYYVKKFHSRHSKYIDRLPYIEARWSSVLKDNRNNFAYNTLSNLYMYRFVRGELTNVQEPVTVRLQDHLVGVSASYSQTFSAELVETGIYKMSASISNTASFSGTFYDIWYSGSVSYLTGNFVPLVLTGSTIDQYNEYAVSVENLKRVYAVNEEARVKVLVRKKNFRTHVGVMKSASFNLPTEYIEKMYYSIENDETGHTVVPFGTGSVAFTQLSYDANGNYMNLFMNSFIPGFKYRVKFLVDINKYDKKIYDDDFTFKVI